MDEGRKRARQNGIKFGRKPKLTTYQRPDALERLVACESQSSVARNVDRATISRLARGRSSASLDNDKVEAKTIGAPKKFGAKPFWSAREILPLRAGSCIYDHAGRGGRGGECTVHLGQR